MAGTLLIHYSPGNPDQSVWSIVNNEGELTTKLEYGSLSDAAHFSENNKVVLLLDSSFIHINQVQIPTKNKQKLLHAAPFALEEQLADEIEDLHFVVASNTNTDKTAVACIRHDILDAILNDCADAGIRADAVLPDSLCLAADDKQWAILLFNESAYIQQHALLSANIEREYFKTLLDFTFDDDDTKIPEKIILFQNSDEECEQIGHDKLSATEIINVSFNDHPLVVFCGHYKQAMPLNLLQNKYKPVRKGNAQLKRWRIAASLAFIWLTLHLGNTAYLGTQLEASNQELRAQIINIYKDSFPESKKIVNARVQMEQKLNGLRSGSNDNDMDFMSLLGASHKALTSNKDITIKAIDYRNNNMDISITSTNLKSVEMINTKLNNDTLKSEIISSTSENNIVKGKLRIKRPRS